MLENAFFQALVQTFPHTPTASQSAVLQLLSEFLTNGKRDEKLFLLKGFAGTGKTTIIASLVAVLERTKVKTILLAPTGRATKVISEYAKRKAYTIHKHIYYPKTEIGGVRFTLKNNKEVNALYIVDEASMISDKVSFGENSLLYDLINFVYSGVNCKLILIGDTAQLPPVHTEISPALDYNVLSAYYHKEVSQTELTEVVRQRKSSGILFNATKIRQKIKKFDSIFQLKLGKYTDFIYLTDKNEVQEALVDAYSDYGTEETTFIVRSNKRAVQYNQQIRKIVMDYEDRICVGDLLMVVKNNYFWLDEKSEAGFIANGDTVEILEIYRYENLYGFDFAEVSLQMIDYPSQEPFDAFIILDSLETDSPALTNEQNKALYEAIIREYNEQRGQIKPLNIKENPYFNALQVKYSYAVTCHKSQGGQWDIVFVEKPFLPDNQISIAYLRWLYTAITRAKEMVYLINFPKADFIDFPPEEEEKKRRKR
ncbi:MAG: AAA family ATPase [Capnocytophaga sp.]|nr:AAA family ATPase [Capnocytophaga sp.]